MGDELSRLIEQDIRLRLNASAPAVTYGVWIEGQGWLKNDQRRVFADERLPVARAAAALWGRGAQVLPIDEALADLEFVFIAHRAQQWHVRLVLWIHNGLSRLVETFTRRPAG